MNKILLSIFLYGVIPLLVVFASYTFGLATKAYDRKIDAARERYQNLYLPFMNWIIHAPLDWVSPGAYKPEIRFKLMQLILENSQYMGNESIELLNPLYDAYLRLYDLDVKKINIAKNIPSPGEYNDLFNSITILLLQEATTISDTLKLPNQAEYVLKYYREHMIELIQYKETD